MTTKYSNDDADTHAAPASYVTHGTMSGIRAVLLRALRAGMPVWERGGDIRLLGGESRRQSQARKFLRVG
ncbi:hypothetical protein B0H12DRAFT_457222 [Mycena haematopus]|nr:hypothetical protein B0H12DRAFT_457222 [Mycena haematopus]